MGALNTRKAHRATAICNLQRWACKISWPMSHVHAIACPSPLLQNCIGFAVAIRGDPRLCQEQKDACLGGEHQQERHNACIHLAILQSIDSDADRSETQVISQLTLIRL